MSDLAHPDLGARAIENLALVVTTQNPLERSERGLAYGGGAGGDPVR